MKCSDCGSEMEGGYVYIRGLASSLSWSKRGDVPFFSRRDLEQIDLSKYSLTGLGPQGVMKSWRCTSCESITLKAK